MTVIRVEHLSKQYRLGMIGGATLREDVSRWWALKRGKDDPLAKVGTGPERVLAMWPSVPGIDLRGGFRAH